jgi:hypothetical protein
MHCPPLGLGCQGKSVSSASHTQGGEIRHRLSVCPSHHPTTMKVGEKQAVGKRKDSAMLTEIKSWGRDPENRMKKQDRPKWNPTCRADVVRDRLAKVKKSKLDGMTEKELSGLDEHGMIKFNMEECRKFLNTVDKRAAESNLYKSFEQMFPAKISTTPFMERWMVCTPPENVDRPARQSSMIDRQVMAAEGKKKMNTVVKGMRKSMLLSALGGGKEAVANVLNDLEYDDTTVPDPDEDPSAPPEKKTQVEIDEEKEEMERQLALTADKDAEATQKRLSMEAKSMEEYWRCLHPLDAINADRGKLRSKDEEIPLCDECECATSETYCNECEQFFCDICFPRVHSRGRLREHKHTRVQAPDPEIERAIKREVFGTGGRSTFYSRASTTIGHNMSVAEDEKDDAIYAATPRTAYVRAMKKVQLAPEPTICRAQSSRTFSRAFFGLGGKKLLAARKFLERLPRKVIDVDLSDNRLADNDLAEVIQSLSQNKLLEKVTLSRNRFGMKAATALAEWLKKPDCCVEHLDLAYCQLGDAETKVIAEAIKTQKQSSLKELHMEHNNIRAQGGKSLGDALSKQKTIEKVYLQWNPFGDEGGQYISRAIKTNGSITHLDMHMTGFADGASKIMANSLKFNSTLTWLNLSFNPISDTGAEAIADGLVRNKTIETINLNHILGGNKGARALIKSIEKMEGDVQRNIQMEGLDHALKKFQEFNAANPGGRYGLDLSIPYEREIALALVRMSGQNRNLLWSDVMLDGFDCSQKHVNQMHKGTWKVPKNGIFEFKIEVSGSGRIPDEDEIRESTDSLLSKLKGSTGMKRLQILAETEGMFIDIENAQRIMELFPGKDRVTAMLTILPKLVDHDAAMELVEQFLTIEQQVELDQKMGMIFGFCHINPTGRYKLDLNDHYQRLVVMRCLDISKDEQEWLKNIGLSDTSQHGNGTGFRNEKRNGRKMEFKHSQVFGHNGIVEFDFVSRIRPLPASEPMDDELFEKMLGSMGFAKRKQEEPSQAVGSLMATIAAKKAASKWKRKVKNNTSTEAMLAAKAKDKADSKNIKAVLNGLVYTADGKIIRRGVGLAHNESLVMKIREYISEYEVFFTCEHLEHLISVLPPKPQKDKIHKLKIEMIVAMFARLVDVEHFSWSIMHSLSKLELNQVVQRLGWLNVFDPYHPQGEYNLNLEKAEHRKLASMLCRLVQHEEDFQWVDSTYDGFPFDLPVSWSRRVPKTGRVYVKITHGEGGDKREEWDQSTRVHYKDRIENMSLEYLDGDDRIRVNRLMKKLDRCKKMLEGDSDSYYYQQMENKLRNDISKITHQKKYGKNAVHYGRVLGEESSKHVLRHVLCGTRKHYDGIDHDDLYTLHKMRERRSMMGVALPTPVEGEEEGGKKMVFVFQPEQSVFANRIEEADSGSYYDDEVLRDMLICDWERAMEHENVKNFIIKRHQDGVAIGDEQKTAKLLTAIFDELTSHRAHIYNTFDFYAVMGSGSDITQIQLNQFTDLLDDCNIPDKASVTCNRAALDRIFIATNREDDDQDDATADVNDDSSLMRFEFIEIFIRIAIAKYIESGQINDVPTAVRKLMAEHFAPNKGEGSCNALIEDASKFRKAHVYQEDTDNVLREHIGFLRKVFKGYTRDSDRGMIVKEFITMLRDMDFLNSDFTQREAKLAFVWSKVRVIDEVQNRSKIMLMSFLDFLECMLRLAQLKNMPAEEDLQKMASMRLLKTPTYLSYLKASVGSKANKLLHRPSNEWGAPHTRPLADKLRICVEMMKAATDRLTGITKKFHLASS